ncbi:UDP-N-acetylglucosamine--N-acetylmuramyl- (pentapeptide) pyrophosphoryl-undecaprenol N-acetylglucosamine transferase [Gossypium arboreum]|uniref:UDP-N-acetylglucosamine--N-acetylmuramyl-(Pentapeptide) pyrophosphoryl-undecaprenol N-acetylglucosamine transferase n=1 Tax=Gossypium arboreum TaxID=29729 RepID=A0A0B0PAA7_GOSAR|nr:UDP-N-acetylglucosamine--N-acetylmuramyl- (pentapeptide) pyrophosphoryl-undecaprenol N-acetylglucosamine transferase [Gossypium arboreum]
MTIIFITCLYMPYLHISMSSKIPFDKHSNSVIPFTQLYFHFKKFTSI